MRLDSGQLVVNGVSSFSLVEGYELEIEPDSTKQVIFYKNRDFKIDGSVTEGDFIYNGRNFEFNYDQFIIDMKEIDSIKVNVDVVDSTQLVSPNASSPQKKKLSNSILETSGILYIEEPHKKAGHQKSDIYPYFITNSEALIYFDGKEILEGSYDKSVFFVVRPFEVDSVDQSQAKDTEFEGRFVLWKHLSRIRGNPTHSARSISWIYT